MMSKDGEERKSHGKYGERERTRVERRAKCNGITVICRHCSYN